MKKRRIKFMPRFWVILAVLVFSYISLSVSSVNGTQTEKMEYVVQSGDTLWDIAEEYSPNDMDIREYIYNIKEHNGLETLNIHPGMALEIEREIK